MATVRSRVYDDASGIAEVTPRPGSRAADGIDDDYYAHRHLRHAMRYSLWSHHEPSRPVRRNCWSAGVDFPVGLPIGIHGVAERYGSQSRGRRMAGGRAAPARPVVVQLGRRRFGARRS